MSTLLSNPNYDLMALSIAWMVWIVVCWDLLFHGMMLCSRSSFYTYVSDFKLFLVLALLLS